MLKPRQLGSWLAVCPWWALAVVLMLAACQSGGGQEAGPRHAFGLRLPTRLKLESRFANKTDPEVLGDSLSGVILSGGLDDYRSIVRQLRDAAGLLDRKIDRCDDTDPGSVDGQFVAAWSLPGGPTLSVLATQDDSLDETQITVVQFRPDPSFDARRGRGYPVCRK